ncbi:MAG: GTP-binding protein [Myxococcota bacterium]
MAQVNPLTRELLIKLVYYGPGLGGKTTSLQRIHSSSPPETRGQIVSLATPVDRTLYFDFLPLRLPPVRDLHVRLQLFTVPGQVYFNATRKLVLTGADGVVFVADSQRERHDANLESLENLQENLAEQGRPIEDMPLVLQYNKRDLPNVLGIEELDRSLNPRGAPSFGTCATEGQGVLDALDKLVQMVLEDVSRRHDLGPVPEPGEGPRFARAEAALEEQIGRASEELLRSDPPAAHRPSAPPAAGRGGPSWVPCFPRDAEAVAAIERHLREAAHARAVEACAELAEAILRRVSAEAGLAAGGGAGSAAALLGVQGERWLRFRRLVRRVRQGGPVSDRDALGAYAVVIDLRFAEERSGG